MSVPMSVDEIQTNGKSEEAEDVIMHDAPPPVSLDESRNMAAQQKNEGQRVVWKKVHPRAAFMSYIPPPRQGHKVVAFNNTVIMFSGGNEGIFDDLHLFDTATNEWSLPGVTGEIPKGRASYGMVLDGHRILIFGGMEEGCVFSDALYELNLLKWEWKLLKPMPRSEEEKPNPRIGHSFTLIQDKAFLFGGLVNPKPQEQVGSRNVPNYLNDLHVLHLNQNMQHGIWEVPITFGTVPSPRESHSAVAYVTNDTRKLVVFGGMGGHRFDDLFTLDVDKMLWCKVNLEGSPQPHSFHTASLVGDKMYVFGGWTDSTSPPLMTWMGPVDKAWKCDNAIYCLNLSTMKWEKVVGVGKPNEEEIPAARAGHCAVAIENNIYVFGGRDGYRTAAYGAKRNKQVCFNDIWKLTVLKPGTASKVRLVSLTIQNMSLEWDPVNGADGYILQMQSYKPPSAGLLFPAEPTGPPIVIPFSEGGSIWTTIPTSQSNPIISPYFVPRAQSIVGIVRQVPSIPAQNANMVQFGMNTGASSQQVVAPQVERENPRSLLPPPATSVLTSTQPQVRFANHPVFSNFRPLLTQNSIRPGIQQPVQPPVSQPAAVVNPSSNAPPPAQSPDIAPRFDWQNMKNPQLTQSVVEKILRHLAVERQQPSASPNTPRPVAPTERLTRPVVPAPFLPQPNDSSLMPPPAAVPGFSNTKTSDQQLQGSVTQSETTSMIQTSVGPVRILNNSPVNEQQSAPSASVGIQGSCPSPQGRPSIIMSTGGNPPPVNPGHQQATQVAEPGSTPHQQQQPKLFMNRSLPYSVRFVAAPGQGSEGQGGGSRAMTAFIGCRMPNGQSIFIPAHKLARGSALAIRQIRLPVPEPLPVMKDDGRKMVAVQGMLQLAGVQNVQQNVEQVEQQDVPQQQGPPIQTSQVEDCSEGGNSGAGSTTAANDEIDLSFLP